VAVIAIDAMGGDFAPREIVAGGLCSVKEDGIPLALFGNEKTVTEILNSIDPAWHSLPLKIVHMPLAIGMGDEPVQAVKSKQNSSLVGAVASVRDGFCDAVISAGNSGAAMAAALFLIGREEGIDRPALTGLIPGVHKPTIALDLGANADCKPINLFQFAQLGVKYAKDVCKIDNPIVGLLSNGEEKGKGSLLVKEAFKLLENAQINFFGNVEPLHILENKVDVVVCDGFSGNVLLKTFEATAALCGDSKMRSMFESVKHGGALLLGVKKRVIISHGSSRAIDIVRAVRFATKTSCTKDLATFG
jgi:phosphate acyltransferase